MLSALVVLFAASAAFAAAATDLKASKTAHEQTTLTWTSTAGDVAQYSLDGLTWTDIPSSALSGVQLDPSASLGNSKVIGLTDFTNYYFRIKAADSTTSNVADAFPPDDHAHKYFAMDTNQCAKCHNTHTGAGEKLLKTDTVNATCKTCHAGSGSKYQVDAGTVAGAGGTSLAALAGPFGKVFNSASGVTPTSAHIISATINTAPGGNSAGVNDWAQPLGCGSCHSAHPQRGYTGVTKTSYQYRLLNPLLPELYDPAQSKYTAAISVEAYAVTLGDKEGVNYVSGMNQFCAGCHTDYNTSGNSTSADVANGKYSSKTRHYVGTPGHFWKPSSVLPLEGMKLSSDGGATYTVSTIWDGTAKRADGSLACITCHRPHGVTTTNGDAGTAFTLPGGTFTNYSHLLRLDNRGVCQQCHAK